MECAPLIRPTQKQVFHGGGERALIAVWRATKESYIQLSQSADLPLSNLELAAAPLTAFLIKFVLASGLFVCIHFLILRSLGSSPRFPREEGAKLHVFGVSVSFKYFINTLSARSPPPSDRIYRFSLKQTCCGDAQNRERG
jgi:hypothetical protein